MDIFPFQNLARFGVGHLAKDQGTSLCPCPLPFRISRTVTPSVTMCQCVSLSVTMREIRKCKGPGQLRDVSGLPRNSASSHACTSISHSGTWCPDSLGEVPLSQSTAPLCSFNSRARTSGISAQALCARARGGDSVCGPGRHAHFRASALGNVQACAQPPACPLSPPSTHAPPARSFLPCHCVPMCHTKCHYVSMCVTICSLCPPADHSRQARRLRWPGRQGPRLCGHQQGMRCSWDATPH